MVGQPETSIRQSTLVCLNTSNMLFCCFVVATGTQCTSICFFISGFTWLCGVKVYTENISFFCLFDNNAPLYYYNHYYFTRYIVCNSHFEKKTLKWIIHNVKFQVGQYTWLYICLQNKPMFRPCVCTFTRVRVIKVLKGLHFVKWFFCLLPHRLRFYMSKPSTLFILSSFS